MQDEQTQTSKADETNGSFSSYHGKISLSAFTAEVPDTDSGARRLETRELQFG
jgi:hypothetical protein